MKRPFDISDDGKAYHCHICNRLAHPMPPPPEAQSAEFTARSGLRHLAERHAAEWLRVSGWARRTASAGSAAQAAGGTA